MQRSAEALLSKRCAIKQAPARVFGNTSTYLALSRNVRSAGPARSSGAMPVMSRWSGAPGEGLAPVMVAICSTVSPDALGWKRGSLMPPVPWPDASGGSELGPTAEAENLRLVVRFFGDGICEIKPQRPERRIPNQANTHRRADHAVVRQRDAFARLRQKGNALVAEDLARVGINGPAHADILRQEKQRLLQLDSPRPIHRTAQGVEVGARREIARSKSIRCKAAHKIGAGLEIIQDSQLLSAPGVNYAA